MMLTSQCSEWRTSKNATVPSVDEIATTELSGLNAPSVIGPLKSGIVDFPPDSSLLSYEPVP